MRGVTTLDGQGRYPSQHTGVILAQTPALVHPAVVVGANCDGSLRMLAYEIDPRTFQALTNRHDGNAL